MGETIAFNAYERPLVEYAGNQNTRVLFKLPHVSMTHVTLDVGDSNYRHKHNTVSEFYFILCGEGLFHLGKDTIEVHKGAFVSVRNGTEHKLKNIGSMQLEHLVFAVPPKHADMIIIPEQASSYRLPGQIYRYENPRHEAQDGSIVRNLISADETRRYDIELIHGQVPPGRKTITHFHRMKDEIYYIIGGTGKFRSCRQTSCVGKGKVIQVQRNTTQSLENTSQTDNIEFLCLATPAFGEQDFIRT